jgi:hypothetical protein
VAKLHRALYKACLPIAVVALILPVVISAGQSAAAQTSHSALAVSPAIIEEVLTPGAPAAFALQVRNITHFPLPIKSFVRDLTVQSAELEQTNSARLDASRWFVIDEPDFILQPDQTRTIKGVITPPADATPGGHYATIYFQPLVPAAALSPSMAYINAKVGALAFLVVKGEMVQKATLATGLHTSPLIRHGPAALSFSIRNTGNVHLMPSGSVTIYDWRGRRTAVLTIPAGLILPDSTKNYTLRWQPPGVIGKYRASLSVHYGADHAVVSSTAVTFWMIPWAELLVGLSVLLITSWLIRRTRRRWRKAWRAFNYK